MAKPTKGKDAPTTDQTEPEHITQSQFKTIMDHLTTMQQTADNRDTTMQEFMTTVTHQLAAFATFVGSHNNAASSAPATTPGSEGALDLTQGINRIESRNSDNTQSQQPCQSGGRSEDLPNNTDARAKDLEKTQKPSGSRTVRSAAPGTQQLARGPVGAQVVNENGGAESSSAAQMRATNGGAVPETPTRFPMGIGADERVARGLEEQLLLAEFPDGIDFRESPNDSHIPRSGLDYRIDDKEDALDNERNDQAALAKSKRNKGKGRAIDDPKQKSCNVVGKTSRTSSVKDSEVASDAPQDDAGPSDTGDATTQVANTRRQSKRQLELRTERKKAESKGIDDKREIPDESTKATKPARYTDPQTKKTVVEYELVTSKPNTQMALPPDPEPRRRLHKTPQDPAAGNNQSSTSLAGDQTKPPTDGHEDRDSKALEEGSTNFDKDEGTLENMEQPGRNGDLEDCDVLNEAVGNDEDMSEAEEPEQEVDLSLASHTNPGPTDEDGEEDHDDEDDTGSWEDDVEARSPSDAHVPRNHSRCYTIKHNNSRQPTTAYVRQHGRPASSATDGTNSEARPASSANTGGDRKIKRPVPDTEADEEYDAAQSPKKRPRPK